jgi:DNA-binding response OmpR family regulator
MQTKIMLIEDDVSLGGVIKKFLEVEGYVVYWLNNLSEAQKKFSEVHDQINLVLLDWMLPDGQGIDFLKLIREKNKNVPVIMLTARTELLDKVVGLESGANDYMTKPLEPRELLARMRVQLRQASQMSQEAADAVEVIVRKDIKIDVINREVFYQGEAVYLTKMEFDLLKLLAENIGKPFSRDELLNKVWGFEYSSSTRTVDTHVLQLRQKFSEHVIETVRGVGYRFSKAYQ